MQIKLIWSEMVKSKIWKHSNTGRSLRSAGPAQISIADWNRLRDIAHMCLYTTGDVVYRAKGLMVENGEYIDCDNTSCQSTTPRAKLSVDINSIEVYPNPSTGLYNIKGLDKDQIYNCAITDLSNRVLITAAINADQSFVDLTSLSNGAYFMSIKLRGKEILTKKLILIK